MIGYFNFKQFHGDYLITNDMGHYAFATPREFRLLVRGELDEGSEFGARLASKGFVFNSSKFDYVSKYASCVRGMKQPLLSPTSLHILVVATACNLDCVYCQAHGVGDDAGRLMDAETALRSVDVALESPAERITLEFQGGEPLLNFPVIQSAIERAEMRRGRKEVGYSVVTNLTLLTDEMISFFSEHGVGISTSLDGPRALHDANRPFRDGRGSYDQIRNAIMRVRNAGIGISAIQTTTRESLGKAAEIVKIYADLGFESIFIRPLTPLGLAYSRWDEIGYTPVEFGAFYRDALTAILNLNAHGRSMREGHAALLLEKLLFTNASNYMEQRSPCGAGVGQLAYHVTGDVFTCDEGRMLYEMGDASFRLGNVFEHDYCELVASPVCRATCAASTLESIPGCCDCVYQPYCGVCPVVNYAHDSDLVVKSPGGYRCGVYSEIFDSVFDIIHRDKESELALLRSWFASK